MGYVHDLGVLPDDVIHASTLEGNGYTKCRNQNCDFHFDPAHLDELHEQQGENPLADCPHCGFNDQRITAPVGRPGGITTAGVSLEVQGQIGENLVQDLGSLPGYGPFTWWHSGTATSNSPFDAMVHGWPVEVKTANWSQKRPRGIIKPQDAQAKARAVDNPNVWADVLNDPKLSLIISSYPELKGLLGVLVILDYEASLADVYVKEYAKTGSAMHAPGHINYKSKGAQLAAAMVPFHNPLPNPNAEGFVPAHQRQEPANALPF